MKYFQHKTNALNNPKLRKVIRLHGAAGYGVWWALLEELHKGDGAEINANALWLECFSELLCIQDSKELEAIIETIAQLHLISLPHWNKRLIWRDDIEKRVQTHHVYRKHQGFVFKRDGFKCVYCGSQENLTLDHKIPQSRGGSHDPENLATCCSTCNSSKGAKTPQEWMEGIA